MPKPSHPSFVGEAVFAGPFEPPRTILVGGDVDRAFRRIESRRFVLFFGSAVFLRRGMPVGPFAPVAQKTGCFPSGRWRAYPSFFLLFRHSQRN